VFVSGEEANAKHTVKESISAMGFAPGRPQVTAHYLATSSGRNKLLGEGTQLLHWQASGIMPA
jgi:hypothetical protein